MSDDASSDYYIQQKGWYLVGASKDKTVNDIWNDCLDVSYHNIPDTLRLTHVFVVDMSSNQDDISPRDLRLLRANPHAQSGEQGPFFQNHDFGKILEKHWAGNDTFKIPAGLWIYVEDEHRTVIYVKSLGDGEDFKFYYSQLGTDESNIENLTLEVDKQYIFRRVTNNTGDNPFFIGDKAPENEAGWKADKSTNIEITIPTGSNISRNSGIRTWEYFGLRIYPSFNDDSTNKLWYYCTTHPDMVFQFDVSGQVSPDTTPPTMQIKVGGSTGPITNTDDFITLNLTTSENITGFDKSDIVLTKAGASYPINNLVNFTGSDSAYQVRLNATDPGVYTVIVPSNKYQDLNGIFNVADSNIFQWTKEAPVVESKVTLKVSGNNLQVKASSAFLSEARTTLGVGDSDPIYLFGAILLGNIGFAASLPTDMQTKYQIVGVVGNITVNLAAVTVDNMMVEMSTNFVTIAENITPPASFNSNRQISVKATRNGSQIALTEADVLVE